MTGPYRVGPPEALAAHAKRLKSRAADLNALLDNDLEALVTAVHWLADDASLRADLAKSAGLSEPMVEWALRSTLETLSVERLRALQEAAGLDGWSMDNQATLCAVVLSGNVFTACLRALVIPLALGVPVLAKATARDDVLAKALMQRLPEPFRHCCQVLTFGREDEACLEQLVGSADVVHAYGADDSLDAIRARLGANTLFVPHGHGTGVAILRHDPTDAELLELMDALALDVAAYDQRGCLSPQELWVFESDADRIAEALSRALVRIEDRLPRGEVDAVAERRWGDVAISVGTLYEGPTHAVAVADSLAAIGARHVLVRTMTEPKAIGAFQEMGSSLKAVGYAPLPKHPQIIPIPIPRGVAPRCSPFGTMQTPPFDGLQDGRAPWFGYTLRVGLG